MKIKPKLEFAKQLIADIKDDETLDKVIDSISEKAEIDKNLVVEFLAGEKYTEDGDLLSTIVSAIDDVVELSPERVDAIFAEAQKMIVTFAKGGSCDSEKDSEEDEEDSEEDEEDSEEDEEENTKKGKTEMKEKFQRKAYEAVGNAKFAKLEKELAETKAQFARREEKERTIEFVNVVANLKNRIDALNPPESFKKLLFGKSDITAENFAMAIAKNAEAEGVTPYVAAYGVEAIVQFLEHVQPVVKFTQYVDVKDESEIAKETEIAKFSKTVEDQDMEYLQSIGLLNFKNFA